MIRIEWEVHHLGLERIVANAHFITIYIGVTSTTFFCPKNLPPSKYDIVLTYHAIPTCTYDSSTTTPIALDQQNIFLAHWFHIHGRNTVFIPGERASEVLVLRLNMYKNRIWQWDPRLTTFPRNLPRVVSEGSSSGCQHPCLWPLLPTQVMSEKIPRAPHINPVDVVASLLPVSPWQQAPWGKTSAFLISGRVFTLPCLPLSAVKSHVRRVDSHVTKCHEKASFMRSQLGVLHSFPEWGWSFRYLTYPKTALLILLFQQKEYLNS